MAGKKVSCLRTVLWWMFAVPLVCGVYLLVACVVPDEVVPKHVRFAPMEVLGYPATVLEPLLEKTGIIHRGTVGAWLPLVVVCMLSWMLLGAIVGFARWKILAAGATPHYSEFCSNCGYDLRGLPEPRCPECGTSFNDGGSSRPKSAELASGDVDQAVIEALIRGKQPNQTSSTDATNNSRKPPT